MHTQTFQQAFRACRALLDGRKTFAACGVLAAWALCDLTGLVPADTARAVYGVVAAAIVASLRDALRKVPSETASTVASAHELLEHISRHLPPVPPEDDPPILPFRRA